jgi:AraC family transcriptional regulator of adaptative response/methylated-DNA-[protein]-cysteine methyltransferase
MKSECGKLLREIAVGAIASYGALAAKLGASDARDVTVAISANPIAVLRDHRIFKKKRRDLRMSLGCAS